MTIIQNTPKTTIVEVENDESTIQTSGGTTTVSSNYAEVIISNTGEEFLHNQSVPSDTWNITHTLDSANPSVLVIDSSNDLVFGHVTYPSANQVVLTFSGAFSGKARLM